jgi:Sensors of blue-light using FAD
MNRSTQVSPSAVDPDDIVDCLIYCSLAGDALTPESMSELVARARVRNAADGITGALLLHRQLIVQIFEGPTYAVVDLWRRIAQDRRHHCVVKLVQLAQVPRQFAQWAMYEASYAELRAIIAQARQDMEQNAPTPWADAVELLERLLDGVMTVDQVTASVNSERAIH